MVNNYEFNNVRFEQLSLSLKIEMAWLFTLLRPIKSDRSQFSKVSVYVGFFIDKKWV